MKLLVILSLLLAAPAAWADADVTVTVPTAAVDRSVELCEEYRVMNSVRLADWGMPQCASAMVREAMITLEARIQKKDATAIITQAVRDADAAYKANFPKPFTPATCGDGTVDDTDPDLGEECDDGNMEDGDGCSANCLSE